MNNNYKLLSPNDNSESYKYYIVFSINKKRYAINIKNIIEIINMPEIETTGVMPENIIGLFNYNGLMIKVIDLCEIISEKRNAYSINNKLIISIVEGNCFAIHANNVENIIPFDSNFIQEVPFNLENTIIDEIYKTESDTVSIINMNALDKLISSNTYKQSQVDYSKLFPEDEKSKQILKLRTDQIKKFHEGFLFPQNLSLIHQYILFTLDNFNYLLDLKFVKEFIQIKRQKITKLPYTHDFIKGIINIKGNFLVVLDLKKFINPNNNSSSDNSNKLIIVEGKNFNIALLVDDIKNIRNLKNIKKTITNTYNSPYIYSEYTEGDTLYSILNIEKILNDDSLYINIE